MPRILYALRMLKRAGCVALSCLLCGLTLLGCGAAGPVAGTTTKGSLQPANLAGNWLLLGSLPSGPYSQTGANAEVSFDVNGSEITGAGHFAFPCTSGSGSVAFGYGPVLTGIVASDGTFKVSSPSTTSLASVPGISFSGTVPQRTGDPWQGTYNVSGGPALCPTTSTGAFTATTVADVTGTYAGSGTVMFFPSGSEQGTAIPLTLSLSVQQGGTLYGLGTTVASYSRLALNGSISVSGFSCFSKGATSQNADSVVAGAQVVAGFNMDDGSRLLLSGEITTTDASQLGVRVVTISGGKCAGSTALNFMPLLIRQ